MKKILLSLLAITSLQCAFAQVLFIDSFLYTGGAVLGGNGGWIQSTAGVSGPTLVNANGLLYPNYSNPTSGCAEVFTAGNTGDVVFNTLSSTVTTGAIYASFVINITTAPTTSSNPYCITLGDQSGFAYGVRLLVKPSGAGFVKLGTRKASGADVYGTIDYPINAAHLVILKYVFNTASGTDDECKMYINPANFNAEPTLAEADATAGADFTGNFKNFIIRNNGGTNTPSAKIDEVHVGKTWNDLFAKPIINPNSISNTLLSNFTISPNPTNNKLSIQNMPANAMMVSVTDVQGKILHTTKAQSSIDISQLPAGVYQVLLLDAQQKIVGINKVIKN